MTSPLAGFLERLADPELAALQPELVERLLITIFRDAGFSLTVRDGAGRGRSFTDPEVHIDAGGGPVAYDDSRFRYFGTDGSEIPRLQHPVHQVRSSGTREQNRVIGLSIEGGRQRWFLASYLPLAHDDDGWSTLTIAADVSTLLERRQRAEAHADASAALLELASSLLQSRDTDPATIAAAAQPFANSQFPQCTTVLSILEGHQLRLWPVQLQPGIDTPPERMPVIGRGSDFWSPGTCVNLAVKDTDIFGNIVVGALNYPFRSIAVVPVVVAGERSGSLTTVSLLRDAFSEVQIATLEQAGALIGHALAEPLEQAA